MTAQTSPRAASLRDKWADTTAELASVWGLRLLARWGYQRVLRIVIMVIWVAQIILVVTEYRPDLAYPADFGSDTSNYVAAGERAMAGHDLYRLQPGDRPAPQDNPPKWSAAILSPPTVPLVWMPIASLPEGLAFYGTWTLGLAATILLGTLLVLWAPWTAVVVITVYLPGLAMTGWSGNVNALIGPALAGAWWATRERVGVRPLVAGVTIGLLAAVKLSPAILLLWLALARHRSAFIACLATAGTLAALGIVLLGPEAVLGYLSVARDGATAPDPLSIQGIALSLGAPPAAATVSLVAVISIAAGSMIALRGHERASYGIGVICLVFATPVVRRETIAVVVAALTPWILDAFVGRSARGRTAVAAAVAVTIPVLAFALASATAGGLVRSTLVVTNLSSEGVVVRFTLPFQDASFGFGVDAGMTGSAWTDLPGGIPAPAVVLSADCQRQQWLSLPRSGGVITITVDGEATAAAGVAAPASTVLAYTSRCASAIRR